MGRAELNLITTGNKEALVVREFLVLQKVLSEVDNKAKVVKKYLCIKSWRRCDVVLPKIIIHFQSGRGVKYLQVTTFYD